MARRPGLPGSQIDFNEKPFVVIWEVTRACELVCLHCRAEAQPHRHPLELTTEQGKALIDQVAEIAPPVFVLTGGDPLMRPDLAELVAYATDKGLRVAGSPSGTRRLAREALAELYHAGMRRISISLDGPAAEVHDAFRGVAGSFSWCMDGAQAALDLGLELQVNTTVTRHNLDLLPEMAELVARLGARLWSVFFLVPTGRGRGLEPTTAEENERVLRWLWELSLRAPYAIKTTEACHYRRVILQRQAGVRRGEPLPEGVTPEMAAERMGRPFVGTSDGRGFVFVSHIGEIMPSGFLPIDCGNVREQRLIDVYRHHPVFLALRQPDGFKGKCGMCEFNKVCGGSRARAYALTGDYLESDPGCSYLPPRWLAMTRTAG